MKPINFPRHDFASCWFAGVALCFIATASLATGGVLGLVPLPQTVQRGEGVFQIHPSVRIFTDVASHESAEYLAARLRGAAGCAVSIETASPAATDRGDIFLTTQPAKAGLGEEGYALSVSNDGPALPDGFDPAASKGHGMRIVRSFVERIGGELRIGRGDNDQGTRFTILFA